MTRRKSRRVAAAGGAFEGWRERTVRALGRAGLSELDLPATLAESYAARMTPAEVVREASELAELVHEVRDHARAGGGS